MGDEDFCLTEGVRNINIPELTSFHNEKAMLVTVVATQPFWFSEDYN